MMTALRQLKEEVIWYFFSSQNHFLVTQIPFKSTQQLLVVLCNSQETLPPEDRNSNNCIKSW